jgi:hypothetical protein
MGRLVAMGTAGREGKGEYEMTGIVCLLVLFGIFLWAQFCNMKTYKQRERLISFVYSRDDWRDLSEKFNRTSYNYHCNSLILFKNVKNIYDPILWPALDRDAEAWRVN